MDTDAPASPTDSARNALNAADSDARIRNVQRDRTSSLSPSTGHHLAPQSAAYQRRLHLLPTPPTTPPTRQTLSLDPVIVIPHPCATYALAATPCLGTFLTGNADGYVRSYDFWASANSGAALSALQRGVANLGEGVNKAGVGRGYWKNEVEVEEGSAAVDTGKGKKNGKEAFSFLGEPQAEVPAGERKRVKRAEPVYSLAVQSDGLWSLSGTEVGHSSP
jgi:transcriptional activator SPT8